MITVTNNSPQQINAAILAILREIELLKKQVRDLSSRIKKLEDSTNTV